MEHIHVDCLVDGCADPGLVEYLDISNPVEVEDLAKIVLMVETDDEVRIGMNVVGFHGPVGECAADGRRIVVENHLPLVLECLLQQGEIGSLVLVGEYLATQHLLLDDFIHLA